MYQYQQPVQIHAEIEKRIEQDLRPRTGGLKKGSQFPESRVILTEGRVRLVSLHKIHINCINVEPSFCCKLQETHKVRAFVSQDEADTVLVCTI